jgi:hypothetical protein
MAKKANWKYLYFPNYAGIIVIHIFCVRGFIARSLAGRNQASSFFLPHLTDLHIILSYSVVILMFKSVASICLRLELSSVYYVYFQVWTVRTNLLRQRGVNTPQSASIFSADDSEIIVLTCI